MPGFNGSGPAGAGPMTGGGRGLCNPVNANRGAWSAAGFGRGLGFGRGFMRGGSGMRRGFGGRGLGWNQPVFFGYNAPDAFGYNAPDAAGEIEMLKNQADYAKNSLDAIHKKIAELEKGSE